MKSTYTLHKLPEGFILTSDEKPLEKDNVLVINRAGDTFIDIVSKITEEGLWTCDDNYYYPYKIDPKTFCFKVFVQQDQIDFSFLSEKEQKDIGWFDYATQFANDNGRWYGRIEGVNKGQEPLSDKRFTLEDMRKAFDRGEWDGAGKSEITRNNVFNNFIQSLSQPKTWKVELEMECISLSQNQGFNMKAVGSEFEWQPKLTNSKIKILKLL